MACVPILEAHSIGDDELTSVEAEEWRLINWPSQKQFHSLTDLDNLYSHGPVPFRPRPHFLSPTQSAASRLAHELESPELSW